MNQQGNEFYEINISRRPHGGFCCSILELTGDDEEPVIAMEGFFTTSLPTMQDVSEWLEKELKKLKQ